MTGKRKVIVAGASGVVGSAVVSRLLADGCAVVAVSRRPPQQSPALPGLSHVPVDLRDRADTRRRLRDIVDATHIVYAALHERPGLVQGWREQEQMRANLEMLTNMLDALRGRTPLAHVTLLQGTKAYGAHLHRIPIPAREDAARDRHDNFYWLQEDLLRERAAQDGWAWTILRPQTVLGGAVGAAMNPVPVLGVFGALCRELRLPFGFPGGRSFPWQASDARIVASAAAWAGRCARAAGETFNITNGEAADWRQLWPDIAAALNLEPAPDRPRRLATFLPQHADVWRAIAERDGLRYTDLGELLGQSHIAADYCFATDLDHTPPPVLVSTIKARQAGFSDCVDTRESLRYWLDLLVARRVLPHPSAH